MQRAKHCLYALSGIIAIAIAIVGAAPSAIAQDASTDQPRFTVPEGMALVPGATFTMGTEDGHADEQPVHEVTLRRFLIDRHEVTNAEFAEFVEATGHVTQAEKDGYAWCFIRGESDFVALNGANWRHPQGPGSSIEDRMDHPVVCVSWEDAAAYARWRGKRLPTEAEWEYVARGGGSAHVRAHVLAPGESAHSAGGAPHGGSHHEESHDQASPERRSEDPSSKSHRNHDSASPAGHRSGDDGSSAVEYIRASVWEGVWPQTNKTDDGYYYTAPVGSFEPNALGVYDMIGNVWEWTNDWYAADYYARSPRHNPPGPSSGDRRVARGGSWFCSLNYCGAFTSHYRGGSPPTHAFNNVGFRCAADVPDGVEVVDAQDNTDTAGKEGE